MRSIFSFVVEPYNNKRYNNTKKINDTDLILNTQIFTHQNVNRVGIIKSLPILNENNNLKIGDNVIVHHNIFRRFHNIRGDEQNSKSYIDDNNYLCNIDQIFAYKRKSKWEPLPGYSFVKPIVSNDIFSLDKEHELKGVLKYLDANCTFLKEGDLVGFTPNSEYEFIIDGEKLYRVRTKDLTIKYEYQGNEKEYNPVWT
tara:strand:+ start:523 stop:1119 length:597 start_codon:yes stop_codon:yes gene_type:complete